MNGIKNIKLDVVKLIPPSKSKIVRNIERKIGAPKNLNAKRNSTYCDTNNLEKSINLNCSNLE